MAELWRNYLVVSISYFPFGLNKKIKKKGFCHGECLSLMELLKDGNAINLNRLLKTLEEQIGKISFLQTIEIMRGCFQSRKDMLSVYQNTLLLLPKIDVCHQLRIDRDVQNAKEKAFARMSEILESEKEASVLIRCWNSNKNIAHTLLFHTSESGRYLLYNSYWTGLYRYPNKNTAIQSLKDHLVSFYFSRRAIRNFYHLEIYRCNQ